MKTIELLQKEKESLIVQIDDHQSGRYKITNIRRVKQRLSFVKKCIEYLRTNPDQSFLEKEKGRLNKRIDLFKQAYIEPDREHLEKMTGREASKLRIDYEKNMGIPKLRKHLRTINYLLKS